MCDADILITRATCVTASAVTRTDIAVRGETISAIGPGLACRARHVIEASGCYLFPGFIDPHVHMSLPIGDGLVSSDDFTGGAIAAACGGTTTIIDFTTQRRGESLVQAVAERRAQADGHIAVDYGLHLTVTDASTRTLAEIQRLAAEGYPSLKLYTTYPALMVNAAEMALILRAVAECGSLALVHAEDHAALTRLTAALLAAGHTSPAAYPQSRPCSVEAEATERAIALARTAGALLYVAHVSCQESLAVIERARAAGQPVFAETCPHYLLLTADEYGRRGFAAAKYVMAPPLRTDGDRQALWRGVQSGTIDVVSTDHCPWMYATQKSRGRERFDLIPGGIAGVETRGELLYSEGVSKNRLALQRFAAVMAENPARLFGLYPRKGALALGSDADLVVFDPRRSAAISKRRLHQNVDYTVFEGWKVVGQPALTISRGRVVAQDGRFVGETGHGRFVARSTPRAPRGAD